jgi:hypothetical protein
MKISDSTSVGCSRSKSTSKSTNTSSSASTSTSASTSISASTSSTSTSTARSSSIQIASSKASKSGKSSKAKRRKTKEQKQKAKVKGSKAQIYAEQDKENPPDCSFASDFNNSCISTGSCSTNYSSNVSSISNSSNCSTSSHTSTTSSSCSTSNNCSKRWQQQLDGMHVDAEGFDRRVRARIGANSGICGGSAAAGQPEQEQRGWKRIARPALNTDAGTEFVVKTAGVHLPSATQQRRRQQRHKPAGGIHIHCDENFLDPSSSASGSRLRRREALL